IARSSRLPWMNLRYIVTLGNQLDATCADWLEALAEDPEVAVLGCYVEGFRPLDGVRWLEIARRITEGGRRVVLYRGGRTHAGAQAAASHTASIAGDTEVSLALARSAGVLVAESLEHFEDLLSLAVAWKDKTARGRRLGAVSNAGYECVAIGDGLGRFSLPELSQASLRGIADVLEQKGLGSLVTPGNPLDLTPMADDEGFAEAARRVLEDPGVDLGLVGCVPQTRALETLEPSPVHEEDLHAFGAVAGRLRRLSEETVIPWAAVVDSGSAYDGLALELQRGGVATFRTVDRALAAITPWVEVGLSFLRPLNP
ncbi:MAG: acetate--CoA ligase family protein, partial [Acidobacteria bacterium]|nr:acetate--CoA ligase family protein [Acidobacteriota bacterium]